MQREVKRIRISASYAIDDLANNLSQVRLGDRPARASGRAAQINGGQTPVAFEVVDGRAELGARVLVERRGVGAAAPFALAEIRKARRHRRERIPFVP